MSQILHIFRKDTRRFWPEIVLSLAALAGVVYDSGHIWRRLFDSPGVSDGVSSVVSLPLLVVASWAFLIARVIHAESLVGDREFWLTRPYDWKKLLAAKVLFLVAYLYLPLVMAQCVMLKRAGFHPQWHVAGLLYNLLLITSYVVVPCVAIACVTANVARMVRVIVGLFACVVGLVALNYFVVGATFFLPQLDKDWMLRAVLLCLCVAAIGLQYATRRTWLARIVLLAIPVCIFAVAAFAPMGTVERAYALRGGESLRFAYSLPANESYQATPILGRQMAMGIPFEVSGLPDKRALVIDDVKIEMETADGRRWVSPWESNMGIPVSTRGAVNLMLPRSIYASFAGKPLSVHMTFAISEGQEQSSSSIAMPSLDVAVAGDGICSAKKESSESPQKVSERMIQASETVSARCRFPMRLPYQNAEMLRADTSCGAAGGQWSGSLGTEPATFAIDPVWIGFDGNATYSYTVANGPFHFCPITGVSITQYGLERHVQASMTIADYKLPSTRALPVFPSRAAAMKALGAQR